MARNVDAETARRHAALLAELEALFADMRVPDDTPASPPPWVVAPEGIPPFSFLIQRHAHPAAAPRTPRQHPARADQLGVSLNPPPEAPPRVPSAQEETLPYKGPPAMAVPRPSLQAPAREERPTLQAFAREEPQTYNGAATAGGPASPVASTRPRRNKTVSGVASAKVTAPSIKGCRTP